LNKVLLGIVTYEGKDYIWDKFWNNILRLTYPNLEIVIIDNSENKKYYSELKRRTKHDKHVKVMYVNRRETTRETQAVCLNRLREYFLKGDYSHLMLIESDLIPPVDIIERLMSHGVGVVGSIYLIGHADSATQPPRPCLFGIDFENEGATKNFPPEVGFGFFGKGLIRIHGCGFGSTLFQRWVINRFIFTYDLGKPIKHSDVMFYKDYHNSGFRAFCDTDIIIPHYPSRWEKVKDI
jgi:hypothetical protein